MNKSLTICFVRCAGSVDYTSKTSLYEALNDGEDRWMQSNVWTKWIIHSWKNWNLGELIVVNQANEVDLWINIKDKGGKLYYQKVSKELIL